MIETGGKWGEEGWRGLYPNKPGRERGHVEGNYKDCSKKTMM